MIWLLLCQPLAYGTPTSADAFMKLGKKYSKQGQYDKAARTYQRAHGRARGKQVLAKSCFMWGFTLYEGSHYEQSGLVWQQCLPKLQGTSWHESALWYLAFVARLQHRPVDVQHWLQQLLQLYPESVRKPKYLFWLADSLQAGLQWQQARVVFSWIQQEYPQGYYAFRSAKRLQTCPLPGQIALEASWYTAAQSANKGFWAQLQTSEIPTNVGAKKENASQNGSVNPPYLTPWRKIVVLYSKRMGVPASLVYATMRVESGFERRARSLRGARGLMQLRLATAKQMAQQLGRKPPSQKDLFVPWHSITLGITHMANLQKKFAQPHLAIAAYNAGQGTVSKWIKHFGHLTPELFVERIPFGDTREYVRKVLTGQQVYEGLLKKRS